MKNRIVLASAIVVSVALLLTGCRSSQNPATTNDSSNVSTGDYVDDSASDAYNAGFDGNYGASPALLNNAGGAENFCKGQLGLHSDYTQAEKADYVQGCLDVVGGSTDSSSNQDPAPIDNSQIADTDIFSRLNNAGNDYWNEDSFNLQNPPAGFVGDYLADGNCTLWQFDNGPDAEAALNSGFLDNFTDYYTAWGEDQYGNGAIAMYDDATSGCSNDMITAMNWESLP